VITERRSLERRLEEIARAPSLLVACDYDGTLAPIVDDPAHARPVRESIVAIRSLASMPQTSVSVISGRSLRDLADLTGGPEEVHLVGSHGSEFDPDFVTTLSDETLSLRERIEEQMREIAAGAPGLELETKPASVALHYRKAPEQVGEDAVKRILDGPASLEGVHVKRNKKVIECSVVQTNKGRALEQVRHRIGATACVFLGDDVTDEDAFGTLAGPDIGVKVGDGESIAQYRVSDTTEVARVLAQLVEKRAVWLAGAGAVPIAKHSLLSDQRTAALVTPSGRIAWLCAPRLDSAAIFADLLGGETGGYFSVRPEDDDGEAAMQHYEGDTFVLSTRWRTLTLTDYLDCSDGRVMQRAGRVDLVRVLQGAGTAVVEFAPRLNFGRTPTRLVVREEGLVVEGSLDPIVLRAPGVEWEVRDEGQHQTAVAKIDLSRGPRVLEMRYGTAALDDLITPEHERRRNSGRFWSNWATHLALPPLHADLVRRSALILKSLCYGPTGAICAAATTSLPEWIGGVRNWDYRYCWPRDAAIAARALSLLGSHTEGLHFLDWLLGVLDRIDSPDRLAPLYTVMGAELGPEAEISDLAGYAGSRPVRVGNAAASQIQLDVFGPIVDLIDTLLAAGAPLSAEHWRLTEAMVEAVRARWRDPDHGIWEVRRPRDHHVHSKTMCWMTVDRALRIARTLVGEERAGDRELRDAIAADIFASAWNDRLRSFTATYDGHDVDAATLLMGLVGLLEPTDERFALTVEAVEHRLLRDGAVYRYRYDDGLPGEEGAFHLCTCWLIECLAMLGRVDDAHALFGRYIKSAGPTGLLSEMVDPHTGATLGNLPQAYSHAGLISVAIALSNSASRV